MKSKVMQAVDYEAIDKALSLVHEGITKRLDLNSDVKIYSVGENVIRIDIKK